jgi:hypothetical protein
MRLLSLMLTLAQGDHRFYLVQVMEYKQELHPLMGPLLSTRMIDESTWRFV